MIVVRSLFPTRLWLPAVHINLQTDAVKNFFIVSVSTSFTEHFPHSFVGRHAWFPSTQCVVNVNKAALQLQPVLRQTCLNQTCYLVLFSDGCDDKTLALHWLGTDNNLQVSVEEQLGLYTAEEAKMFHLYRNCSRVEDKETKIVHRINSFWSKMKRKTVFLYVLFCLLI